jgi:GxxExxY protein
MTGILFVMTLSHPDHGLLTHRIIGAAIEVHRCLKRGLLESTYEEALAIEFEINGIGFERQRTIQMPYKGRTLNTGYRPDMIVENAVIVEIKAVKEVIDLHKAQLLTYVTHSNLKLGLLFNFNAKTILGGMTRVSL